MYNVTAQFKVSGKTHLELMGVRFADFALGHSGTIDITMENLKEVPTNKEMNKLAEMLVGEQDKELMITDCTFDCFKQIEKV